MLKTQHGHIHQQITQVVEKKGLQRDYEHTGRVNSTEGETNRFEQLDSSAKWRK